MTKSSIDRDWIGKQISEYAKVYARYEEYTNFLYGVLKTTAKEIAPLSIVQARTKPISSFADKIFRKRGKHADPVRDFTDLSGARVIVRTREYIQPVCDFIKEHFNIDWENSLDVSELLKPSEFGYRSIHYIVSLSPDLLAADDMKIDIPRTILPDEAAPMKAEIQVRTLLEHAWSEFAHDILHKSSFKLPSSLKRELAQVAAMLENSDSALSRMDSTIKRYETSYESCMTPDEIQDEIAIQEVILEHAPQEYAVALKIGQLAIATGDWRKAVDTLSRYAGSGDGPILRDLGVALCKLNVGIPHDPDYKKGQEYLQQAIDICEKDVDAIASLAGTWKGIDDRKAWKLYKRAFEIDQDDPYVFGNYMEYEISNRQDASIVFMLQKNIQAAIDRCLEQAEVGTNYPWAFFDLGKFYLLAAKPYEAMTAYMLAIKHATAPFMIENSIESLVKLGPAIEHWFEWAVRLLTIGKAVKFKDAASLDEIARWASRDRRAIKGSVVIAAGSCDDTGDTAVRGHKEMLTKAFADYNGNIISGGTHSGIGGIVGDIQEAYPTKVYTMGYVPAKLPSGCEIDTRYCDTRTSEGSRFSPLQPLQYWADLLRSGIEPASVKLLGVGGNSLALFEYQLALILGAKVGLAGAGDGSHVMNRDELTMSTMSGAIVFPSDAYVLRSFVGTGFPGLPDRIRENVAKALHQTYMGNDSGHLTMSMESMVEWEELPPELKESNRRAVDHIVQKLNEIGCSLEHIEKGDVRLIDFSDGEIEIMAEMEHARWLAEKFELGWKYGPKKDFANKTNPLMVAWDELDEKMKEIDRVLVRGLPKFLADFKLQINRK